MPVHEVKGGYQWGNTGKVYKGKDAKKKAIKQAIAIAYSEAKREGKEKPSQKDIENTIKGKENMEKKASYMELNKQLLLHKAAAAQTKGNEKMGTVVERLMQKQASAQYIAKQAAAKQVYEGLCKLAEDPSFADQAKAKFGEAWKTIVDALKSDTAMKAYKKGAVAAPSALAAYLASGKVPGLKDSMAGRLAVTAAAAAPGVVYGEDVVDFGKDKFAALLEWYKNRKNTKQSPAVAPTGNGAAQAGGAGTQNPR